MKKKAFSYSISTKDISIAISKLSRKHPAHEKNRIKTGIAQVARLWTKEDGNTTEFKNFCIENFYPKTRLSEIFKRFEDKLEYISGHFIALKLQLRKEIDTETGPNTPLDEMFANYSPEAHISSDLFKTKLAFAVLLNFPISSLKQKLTDGNKWSRQQWAEARLADDFAFRVPANVSQKISEADTKADRYINNYNIFINKATDREGKFLFKKELKLISHWGLRDEIKNLYENAIDNFPKQEIIYRVLNNIVTQTIPPEVINDKNATYNPFKNTVNGKKPSSKRDSRFFHWYETFKPRREADKYYAPLAPTYLDRNFDYEMEIPKQKIISMFKEVLSSPLSKEVGKFIETKAKRPLRPFDIWFNRFGQKSDIDTDKLDQIISKKYPTAKAFQDDIPNVLLKLGFDKKTAEFLGRRIEVNPARGAGHAWGPGMRTEKARLRTRIGKRGMDYQGFNTAMHELGHCVEQVFSMYRIDHTLLEGVPNTAFTEGFAFVFQAKDLFVLGLKDKTNKSLAYHLSALNKFWSTREICGVALVDIYAWEWLYKNPKATPKQFEKAVLDFARKTWNEYFAPTFKIKDVPILAIYSHMVNSALYTPNYPLGQIIAFQVEEYFKKHPLAKEMERMCVLGSIAPSLWMKKAIGQDISVKPLINAVKKSLQSVGAK
jgi:hypothetical protein